MKKIHLYASHPDYKKFDLMQNMLLIATNPQMFFWIDPDVSELEDELQENNPEYLATVELTKNAGIPEPERLATVELIKGAIREEMDDYVSLPANLAEIINKLEDKIQAKK